MDIQTTVERNLLKHAVGLRIFCPNCEQIMDVRRAVLASILVAPNHRNTREHVCCAECWDRLRPTIEGLLKTSGGTLEVIDGRVLFASRRQH